MATEGLWLLVCASTLAYADPQTSHPTKPPADERNDQVAATLAVQTAMQHGREQLLQNNARAAVETLERQLPRINGNPAYLALMREAYRAHIKELRLAKRDSEAQRYSHLLAILEPAANGEKPAAPNSSVLAEPAPPAAPAKDAPVVRMKREEDEDFFRTRGSAIAKPSTDLLSRAEEAFRQNNYREADRLFDQAFQSDRSSLEANREKWAYCKLHRVVEQLNQQSTAFPALETEVRTALSLNLSPRVDEYAKKLLAEIEKRRSGAPAAPAATAPAATEPAVIVRDLGRSGEWSVAETANFRIYYKQAGDVAQRAAQTAERTRTTMYRKWFGGAPADWNPKCALYLHPTGNDYTRVTGVPSGSPGHSSFQLENGGRVLDRRIDLHCDVPDMIQAVLPHEATHVVLAGNFGDKPVPRWADEGIAILTEPREKIDRHLHNIPRHAQERQLFRIRELVNMGDYPQPARVGAFYAQSVGLCEFLAKERGPQVLVAFVRDGLRNGYDASLQKHYGYKSFDELEQKWNAWAMNRPAGGPVVQRGP
jgi:tetratricopeptide (TPR) repeat protein